MHNRICELRENKKMTQMQLAEACSVTQQLISKIESSRGAPSMKVAAVLANVLGCTIDDLFRGAGADGIGGKNAKNSG